MDRKKIEEMIGNSPQKGILPCPVAHYIAHALGVAPKEVGDAATELKVKLDLCQLGVFGYGRKPQRRNPGGRGIRQRIGERGKGGARRFELRLVFGG